MILRLLTSPLARSILHNVYYRTLDGTADACQLRPSLPRPTWSRSWRRLRDPETGCEWDSAQTFETIAPYTIEEAYEVADAIRRGDMDALKDELGDLQLQVVYHARMAEERGAFALDDVIGAICAKMDAPPPAHLRRRSRAAPAGKR